jgi:diguanylate cyclase
VLSEEDTAARTGAGDFVVIMPKTTRDRARTRADSIRERMASQALVNKSNGQKLGLVTVSVGVSQYVTGEALGDIVQRANAALERAKAEGANCVVTDEVLEDYAAA